MLQVSVRITGTQATIDKLRRLDASLLNFSSAMNEIGTDLKGYFSGQVFASQGGALGVKWPTLAASTVLYKRKHYPQYATTPLIRTGAMQKSFYSKSTSTSVTVGNNVPGDYFKYHQLGTSRMPRRQMIGISDDVQTIVRNVIQADISKKLESA